MVVILHAETMEKEKQFLPYPEQTLGVLARGTDWVTSCSVCVSLCNGKCWS